MPPEPSKTLSGATRNPVKTNLEAFMGAQMRPRAPERRSKDGQQTPKSAQELAKSASDSPKTGPGDAQTLPKTSPVSSRRVFGLIYAGCWFRKTRAAIFCNFGHSAQCLQSVFRPIKIVVLLHSEHWDSASAHTA